MNQIHLTIYILLFLIFVYLSYKQYHYKKIEEEANLKIKEYNEKSKNLELQKTNFVSIASHQLRGPLTVIQGYVSMILEGDYGKISDEIKESLEKVNSSCDTLSFLINDYLNVSKIDKDELGYIIEDVNINRLINKVFCEFEPVAKKNHLSLLLDSRIDSNIFIKADLNKMHQVLSSLIDNAIKYTPKGNIKISANQSDDFLFIKIIDTGIGIKSDNLKNIFTKFQRSKEAVDLNVTGTGLGLFVSKHFIESQDGEIWAESDGLNKGSSFIIKFPILKKI
ncbi:MAG TPA: HAMP domain-containing sensor histidine kinase [Candidatus Paceibacterota bacterium]|nr:HAMP domain-containing sensor histidine kinase [Candidatus Paceibacterota bacterium]HMP18744.1 HAMP domain-containing sensor histidine kinase [Candidatus Paceibacterota bacterium]HMP85249.1 HAMP domain-containing sensor histidine kinase [Candidatus Paceibacterota bacterium]